MMLITMFTLLQRLVMYANYLQIKISSYQILKNGEKARKKRPNFEDLPESFFSMVIVDEAHHLPADQWEAIVRKFREHAKIVFLTATPIRTNGDEITTDGAISKIGYLLTREDAVKKYKLIREVKQFPEKNEATASDMPQPKKCKKDFIPTPREKEAERRMKYAKEVLAIVKERMEEKNPLPGNKKHASIIIAKILTKLIPSKRCALTNLISLKNMLQWYTQLNLKRRSQI